MTWAQPLVSHPWAGWKFCAPWSWTVILYAGNLCKITLNPTLNSRWKPKREAVSKSYCLKPSWLPVSRAVCQGLVLPKGSEKRHLGFGAQSWVWGFGSRQSYPGKLCPRAPQCCWGVCNRAAVKPSQSTAPLNLEHHWTVWLLSHLGNGLMID